MRMDARLLLATYVEVEVRTAFTYVRVFTFSTSYLFEFIRTDKVVNDDTDFELFIEGVIVEVSKLQYTLRIAIKAPITTYC